MGSENSWGARRWSIKRDLERNVFVNGSITGHFWNGNSSTFLLSLLVNESITKTLNTALMILHWCTILHPHIVYHVQCSIHILLLRMHNLILFNSHKCRITKNRKNIFCNTGNLYILHSRDISNLSASSVPV